MLSLVYYCIMIVIGGRGAGGGPFRDQKVRRARAQGQAPRVAGGRGSAFRMCLVFLWFVCFRWFVFCCFVLCFCCFCLLCGGLAVWVLLLHLFCLFCLCLRLFGGFRLLFLFLFVCCFVCVFCFFPKSAQEFCIESIGCEMLMRNAKQITKVLSELLDFNYSRPNCKSYCDPFRWFNSPHGGGFTWICRC